MFRLDKPERYRLERAPLAQALAQVRFPLIARLNSADGIAPIQDQLRDCYPYMAQRQEIALQVPSQGPPAGTVGSVWELTDDEGWVVSISTGSATLSVGAAYEGVEEFAERFVQIMAVLASQARVPRCDRLGVRYLSVAETLPGHEAGWQEWFRHELTGWAASDLLDDETVAEVAMCQVQLRGTPSGLLAGLAHEIRGTVNHGLVPAGSGISGHPPVTTQAPSYILDIDLSVQAPQPFDPDVLRGQFDGLHSEIDAFFRWSLTPAGERHFNLSSLA